MTELNDELRHHRPLTRRPLTVALMAGIATLALLTTAACSSSPSGKTDSSSAKTGSGLAHAQQQVAKYEKAVTSYPSPGTALDAQKVAALKGKTVLYVPEGLVGPFVQTQQSLQAALGHLGISVKTCDPNFLPPQIASCFGQAKTDGAAAVITGGIGNSLAADAYAALKAQGIPVLAAAAGAGNPPNTAQIAFQSEVPSTELAGTVSADQVIADSGGQAHVLFVGVTGAPGVEAQGAQTKAELAKYCPGCKVASVAFDATDTSQISSGVSSALISNPSTNYILVQADSELPYVLPGVQSSGFINKVKIVAGSGTPAILVEMQQKQHNIIGDSAFDAAYIGWNAADGVLRLLTGQTVAAAPYFPVRLFTPGNLQGLTLSPSMDVSPLYGPATFQQQFYDLWAGKSS
jgi:ribose transport system substrate-binding protein